LDEGYTISILQEEEEDKPKELELSEHESLQFLDNQIEPSPILKADQILD
jgi:hypothetical protein